MAIAKSELEICAACAGPTLPGMDLCGACADTFDGEIGERPTEGEMRILREIAGLRRDLFEGRDVQADGGFLARLMREVQNSPPAPACAICDEHNVLTAGEELCEECREVVLLAASEALRGGDGGGDAGG